MLCDGDLGCENQVLNAASTRRCPRNFSAGRCIAKWGAESEPNRPSSCKRQRRRLEMRGSNWGTVKKGFHETQAESMGTR